MKNYPAKQLRNITFMGHSGSGKTSLVEAMLFNAKVINRMGKPEDGNTVTDFDTEEIRRGISINTAYATCEWNDHKFNLIDVPGDFDFLADQMLGLRAGDVVMVVAGCKDGVSVGSEKTMRFAMKRKQPTALFINRVDEPNADFRKTLTAFQERYSSKIVPIVLPIFDGPKTVGAIDIMAKQGYMFDGKGGKNPCEIPADYQDEVNQYYEQLQEHIAESDEELMMKYFDGSEFTTEEEEQGLRRAIISGSIIPTFAGSASGNYCIAFTMDMIAKYFPSPVIRPAYEAYRGDEELALECKEDGPLAVMVFKTILDPFVGRISLVRVVSGVLKDGAHVFNSTTQKEERINGLFFMQGKKQLETKELIAGEIGAITKLTDTQTNQTLCAVGDNLQIKPVSLPTPCLTLAITPKAKGEEDKIMQGLQKLKEEDLAFEIVNDRETKQLLLSGLGEVQLDVLKAKLKSKYNVESTIVEPKVAYRETIRKSVKVQGKHKKQSGGHGQYGDVWMVFEPSTSEKLEFKEEIFGGSVPKNYHPAVEKGLQEAVEHGVLAGYPVVNLKATLVDGSYHDVDSSEMAFKLAAKLAYRNGLPKADPVLLEPIAAVEVHIPDEYLGDIMGDMSKRRGRILGMGRDEDDSEFQVVTAECPMSEMSKYATDLKSMTQGRGWFTVHFERYEEAPHEVATKVVEVAQKEEE